MYSRVKRKRKVVKRDMYGMPIEESSEDDDSDDSDDSSDGKLSLIMCSDKQIEFFTQFFFHEKCIYPCIMHWCLRYRKQNVLGLANRRQTANR